MIAPYSRKPADWLDSWWIDIHSGGKYRIRTNGKTSEFVIRVQTIGEVIDRFRIHPESKSAGPDGKPANSWTVGLLGRRDIHVLTALHIGKESNLLEQQEEGVLLTDPQVVYWGESEWETIRSQLDRVSIPKLADLSGVSPEMLRKIRRGERRQSPKKLGAIMGALAQMLDEGEG